MEDKNIMTEINERSLPFEGSLCVFKSIDDAVLYIGMVLGSMITNEDNQWIVKEYKTGRIYDLLNFSHFQYILNERGGFYNLTSKNEKRN